MEIQDNVSKAREIGEVCECCMDGKIHCDECEGRATYLGAIEMAEWKDQQFKEFLEKKLKTAEELVKKPQNDILQVRAAGMFNQIHEIINELFGED